MTHVTCRLTAKNRDQLRNPTLGNRVWATFTLFSQRRGYHRHSGLVVWRRRPSRLFRSDILRLRSRGRRLLMRCARLDCVVYVKMLSA